MFEILLVVVEQRRLALFRNGFSTISSFQRVLFAVEVELNPEEKIIKLLPTMHTETIILPPGFC